MKKLMRAVLQQIIVEIHPDPDVPRKKMPRPDRLATLTDFHHLFGRNERIVNRHLVAALHLTQQRVTHLVLVSGKGMDDKPLPAVVVPILHSFAHNPSPILKKSAYRDQPDHYPRHFINTGHKQRQDHNRHHHQHRRFEKLLPVRPGAPPQLGYRLGDKAPNFSHKGFAAGNLSGTSTALLTVLHFLRYLSVSV